jgi:hypothetical protein
MSNITRRVALETLAAAIPAAAQPALPVLATEQDPIFAAIEAHKIANAEWIRLLSISARMHVDDEGYEEAGDASAAASDLANDAQVAMMRTRPTTAARAAAVLRYVASF